MHVQKCMMATQLPREINLFDASELTPWVWQGVTDMFCRTGGQRGDGRIIDEILSFIVDFNHGSMI
jgi:hypothetical protein